MRARLLFAGLLAAAAFFAGGADADGRQPRFRFERRPSEPGKSRFRLHLPAARLPVVAIVLDMPGGPGGPLLRPAPALGAPVDAKGFRYSREIPAGAPGLNALLLDAAVLSRSPGLADLRIADSQGRQVPYLLERLDEPMSLALPALALQAKQGDPPSLSRYAVELPYPSLPAARLVLATTARVFEREIRLVEPGEAAGSARERPGEEPGERTVATAAWRHADPETPAPQLTLELPSSPATRFDLLIEEGDNAPLPLAPPRLLLPANRLRFFDPPGATLTLLYGQRGLPPPRYDLSLLAPRLLGEAAHEITLSPEPRQRLEPDAAATEKKIFWGALVGAVLVLLLLLGRLLSGPPTRQTAPSSPGRGEGDGRRGPG